MSGDMQNHWARLLVGDVRERLATIEARSVQACVTSPPYWGLRAYLKDDHPSKAFELGSEKLHDCCGWATGSRCGECFICHMVEVFEGVKRVLRDDGTLFVNLGDSYSAHENQRKATDKPGQKQATNNGSIGSPSRFAPGLKPKDLCGVPWRFALAMQAAGWWLRSDIIWAKPNPMPSSVTDRVTTSHEYLFMFSKSARYFFDATAICEVAVHAGESVTGSLSVHGPEEKLIAQNAHRGKPYETIGSTRNKRSVWTISTQSFSEAHFATYPEKLVEPCIKAGTSERGCCASCGSPWVRVVEKDRVATRPGTGSKVHGKNSRVNISRDPKHPTELNGKAITNRVHHDAEVVGNRDPERHVTESRTVGWEASCDCQAAVVPCLVLDPFAGAGTTGLVARKLARHFVGTELNEEYAAMAWRRMNAHPKPDVPQVKPCVGQFELFPA